MPLYSEGSSCLGGLLLRGNWGWLGNCIKGFGIVGLDGRIRWKRGEWIFSARVSGLERKRRDEMPSERGQLLDCNNMYGIEINKHCIKAIRLPLQVTLTAPNIHLTTTLSCSRQNHQSAYVPKQ
jgi:hypothetical protein